jgi:hypothetical protein
MAREFWEMQRAEIMRQRREEHLPIMAGGDDHVAMAGGEGHEARRVKVTPQQRAMVPRIPLWLVTFTMVPRSALITLPLFNVLNMHLFDCTMLFELLCT